MPKTFAELGVDPALARSLKDRGIETAFPIQEAAIPDSLKGRDILAKAPTGSGKTIAFGVAAAARCVDAAPRKPKGLVLEPTRELAGQVRDELQMLMPGRERRVLAVYGGTRYGPAQTALNKGIDILVACPGRLEDLLEQGMVDLSEVEVVVVDEADRMADMGFLPSVRRLVEQTKQERQVLLFSATMGREIESLVKQFQHDPARHDVSEDTDAAGDVTHYFWKIDRDERMDVLVTLIGQLGRAIVFCRTRHGSDRVARQLTAAGVEAVAIHGDRTQAQRERALRTFEDGKAVALVATDVAARGIHLDALPGVIHFDPVQDPTDYTHRSGRTGRAGLDGVVVSLVLNDQKRKVLQMQRTLDLPEGFTEVCEIIAPDVPAPTPRAQRTTYTDERPQKRSANRSEGRGDRRSGNRRQTERSSDRSERRPEHRGDRRSSPRGERRADQRGEHRGEHRAEHRTGPKRDHDGSGYRAGSTGPGQRRHAGSDRGPVGTVKFYDAERGYGFVEREGKDDLFVHASGIDGGASVLLEVGQSVTFEVGKGRRGAEARNVRVVGGGSRGPKRPKRREKRS